MLVSLVDTALHRDVVMAADAALRFEEWLFQVPLFLAGLAIIGMRRAGPVWALAVILAFIANESRLFSEIIHGVLDHGGLYPHALRHGNGPVNVQWATLIAYGLVWPVLAMQVIWSKTRHIGRVFTLVIITVTLGTTFLFHQVLINQALHLALEEARDRQFAAMAQAITRPTKDNFLADCRLYQIWCDQAAVDAMAIDPPADFADWVGQVPQKSSSGLVSERRHASPLQRQLIGQQALYWHDDTAQRWAVDRAVYTPIVARYKIYFAILVSAAHLAWAFGGMALLALHRSPLRYRLRGSA